MELDKERKHRSDGDGELSVTASNLDHFHYSSVIYIPLCWLMLTLNVTKVSNNEVGI